MSQNRGVPMGQVIRAARDQMLSKSHSDSSADSGSDAADSADNSGGELLDEDKTDPEYGEQSSSDIFPALSSLRTYLVFFLLQLLLLFL